ETEEAETDATEDAVEDEDQQDPVKKEEQEDSDVEAVPATLEDDATEMKEEAVEKSSEMMSLSATDSVFSGIALKDDTHVYAEQSRDSKKLRSYAQGTILKFRAFNSSWYIATVKVDGAWTSGYIHQSDVDIITDSQSALRGF